MLLASGVISLIDLSPEIILALAGCAVLIAAQSTREATQRLVPWISLVAIVIGILLIRAGGSIGLDLRPNAQIKCGLRFDEFADFVRMASLTMGVLIVLVVWSQPAEAERGEFFAALLFTLVGVMLVGAAADLAMLFLALELVSIPSYMLVALSRRGQRALESGTKYFYLGALAAAITGYGFSLLYGVAGSAAIDDAAISMVAGTLKSPGSALAYTLAVLGVTISIAGLLFKLSAVPMHFYVADVYQGASSSVAGMLGFVPKIAGIVAICRILQLTGWQTTIASAEASAAVFWTLWVVAALSTTVGNILALRQTNVKRMLAYSGVAHSGYMLIGLIAAPGGTSVMSDGPAAALYYVFVYGIANLGAFALLALLEVRGQACETVRDLAGLLRRAPGLALLMALAMLTLMGMPPTPGFWGKLSLFGSALSTANSGGIIYHDWIIALVIIGVVNSAIGAAYYLRVIAAVLLYENDEPATPAPREAQHMGVVLCGFLTLIFAFAPDLVLRQGHVASGALKQRPAITAGGPAEFTAPVSPRP
ncbi:MAG: NADH-quinone oxidoreductase subunit N [Planctomycetota bacterium]